MGSAAAVALRAWSSFAHRHSDGRSIIEPEQTFLWRVRFQTDFRYRFDRGASKRSPLRSIPSDGSPGALSCSTNVRVELTGQPEAETLGTGGHDRAASTASGTNVLEDSMRAVVATADIAQALGANVVNLDMPAPMAGLAAKQPILMAYEASRSLAWEHRVIPRRTFARVARNVGPGTPCQCH